MLYLRDGPHQLSGIAGTFLAFSWVTVTARCYVRAIMIKKFGLEDWFALASLFLYTVYCAFTFDGARHGFGKMTSDLSLEEKMHGLKDWWYCGVFYVATTGFLKASIAVQLLNLTGKRSHEVAIKIVLGIAAAYTTAFSFVLIFQCVPVDFFWSGTLGGKGECIKADLIGALTITHSVLNISGDWFFAVMPMILVKDLALPPRTKITVSIILAFGGLASCVVIIRLPYILILEKKSDQLLYYCTWVINCSTAENGLGISAAAMATLRPLFRSFLSASRTITSSNQYSDSNCIPFGRNRDDLENGTELSTIHKKVLKSEDGTLRVVEDPVLPRSPSQVALRVPSPCSTQMALRVPSPCWMVAFDKNLVTGASRKRASDMSIEDIVIQKL